MSSDCEVCGRKTDRVVMFVNKQDSVSRCFVHRHCDSIFFMRLERKFGIVKDAKRQITLESGKKVWVDSLKFALMKESIKSSDPDAIARYSMETLLSCDELINSMARLTKDFNGNMRKHLGGENMVRRFRKKPVVVETIQWLGNNDEAVAAFVGDCFGGLRDNSEGLKELYIKTREDGSDNQVEHMASVGDYIIKGVKGEFYPCKQNIFLETYDEVFEDVQ